MSAILWLMATMILVLLVQRQLFRGARCNRMFSANTLFFVALGISALSYVSGLVSYWRVITPGITVFLCLSVAAFGAGAIAAGSQGPQKARDPAENSFLLGLAVLAVIYIVLATPGIYLLATTSLQSLRAAHFEAMGEESGLLEVLKAGSRVGAVVFAVNIYYFFSRRAWLWFALGIVSLFGIFVESSSAGGRFIFTFFMIALAVNLITVARMQGLRPPLFRIALIAIPALVFGLAVFPQLRNPSLTRNPGPYFAAVDEVAPAPWILRSRSKLVRDNLIGFAFSSSYFATPLIKLQYSVEAMRVQDWMMMGSYNFRMIQPLYTAVGVEGSSFFEARTEIATVSLRHGYTGNPWATGFRDLLIDFGWAGAVFAAFVVGWVLTRWSALLYESTSVLARALGAAAAAAGLSFPLMSPFVIGPIINSILGVGMMLVVMSLVSKSTPIMRPLTRQRAAGQMAAALPPRRDWRPPRRSGN